MWYGESEIKTHGVVQVVIFQVVHTLNGYIQINK